MTSTLSCFPRILLTLTKAFPENSLKATSTGLLHLSFTVELKDQINGHFLIFFRSLEYPREIS